MADINKKRYESDEIIDGEVVSEFHGETMINLPPVPDDTTPIPTTTPPVAYGSGSGRRDFFVRLMVGGTAALALGGSAALLLNQRQGTQTEVVVPYGSGDLPADAAELIEHIALLERELANRTAERDQALSDLNLANTNAQQLREQLDIALAELEEVQGLNGLWQALDDVGLDSIVRGALDRLGAIFTVMLTVLALVETGLSAGQIALTKFIQSLPTPQDGIQWLQERITSLSNDLDWLTQQVQEAVQPTNNFTSQIAQFILWVLERLPFGAGDRARAGLEAMQTVINTLPETVEGINTSVLTPLADWFGDDRSTNLTGTLITPLQDRVITPTKDLVTQVSTLRTAYDENLAAPANAALEQRDQIREQIQVTQARINSRTRV